MTFDEKLDEDVVVNQPSIKLKEQVNINKARNFFREIQKNAKLIGCVLADFHHQFSFQESSDGVYGQFGIFIPLFNTALEKQEGIRDEHSN
jgi:cobalt-zinc-cadmium resistance protein CzcA